MPEEKDVFLCHASEDKNAVLEPLVGALDRADITYWYDKAEIRWGESFTKRVNEGLRVSRYVIVVLSDAFLRKNWPPRELEAALNLEASTGEPRVLPLLVGDADARARIIDSYPILNDKKHLIWSGGPEEVVRELRELLSVGRVDCDQAVVLKPPEVSPVPLPQIRKHFTQRDKDLFLRAAFARIRDYFQYGLARAEKQDGDVQGDLIEVHNFRFMATIYIRGEIASRCTVWIGGPTSSDSIAFRYGNSGIEPDNSYNDWLSIVDADGQLRLHSSMGGMFSGQDIFSVEEAALYLWRRFIEHVG